MKSTVTKGPRKERPLSHRQQSYVSGVLSGLGEAKSAYRAGYGANYARRAKSTIGAVPAVKRALQEEQAKMQQQAQYDAARCVVEIDRAIVFAYEKSAPMAVGKLLELKAKVFGLLWERVEVVSIDLRGALEAARLRVVPLALAHTSPMSRQEGAPAVVMRPVDPFGD